MRQLTLPTGNLMLPPAECLFQNTTSRYAYF